MAKNKIKRHVYGGDLVDLYSEGGWIDDAVSGAVDGAGLGSSIYPGWGTLIGAVAGFGLGALGGSEDAENARKQEVSEAYKPPVPKSKQLYDTVVAANGMNLKKLSQRTDYKGERHAEGGINLPINVQVEDGETRTGNIVHSENLKVTPDIMRRFNGTVPLRKGDLGRSISSVLKSRDKRFEKRSGDEWNDMARKISQVPFEGMSDVLSEEKNTQMMKKGGSLSKAKARKMLHEGIANGRPITDKQRKMFGAIGYGENGFDLGSWLGDSGNASTITNILGLATSLGSTPENVTYKKATYTPTKTSPISTEGGISKIRRSFGEQRERLRRLNPRAYRNNLIAIGSAEAETIGDYVGSVQGQNAQMQNQATITDSSNRARINMFNSQLGAQEADANAANEAAKQNMIASYTANTATVLGQQSADKKRMEAQEKARGDYMNLLQGYQDIWKDGSKSGAEAIGYDEQGNPIYKKEFGGSVVPRSTTLLKRKYRTY